MDRKELSRYIMKATVPILGHLLMRTIWHTTKKTFHLENELSQEQHIYVCWHGELFMSPQAYRHFHKKQDASAMISHHFDGELIAGVFSHLNISAIRGSGRKGAKEVFLKAFREMKKGTELLITPDGPKGPRHHVYDGAVALAVKGKKPLCIITYTCSNYWQIDSWDRFVIPKPFSSIAYHIEPLDLSDMSIEEAKVILREKMISHTILT